MRQFYDAITSKDPSVKPFHRLAAQDPAAASKAVHKTFVLTLKCLFNCCPPASTKAARAGRLNADGFPCSCEPGILAYLLGYLGIMEP